jgi:flagellar protein FliO/FliZ
MRRFFNHSVVRFSAGFLLISIAIFAAADPTLTVTAPPSAASYLAQLVGGLVLVIVMILVFAWFLRRLPGINTTEAPVIEILAVRAIGARERLVLVQVGTEQILIGATAAGLSHLHTLKIPLVIAPQTMPPTNEFAKLLKQLRTSGLTR